MKRCFIYAAAPFTACGSRRAGAIFRSPRTRGFCSVSALASDRTLCSATSTRWTSVKRRQTASACRSRRTTPTPCWRSARDFAAAAIPSISMARRRRAARPHARQPPVACLPSASWGKGLSLRPKFRLHSHRKRDAYAHTRGGMGHRFALQYGRPRRAHHARGAAISAHGRDDRLRLPARREQPHRCADGAHYGGARSRCSSAGSCQNWPGRVNSRTARDSPAPLGGILSDAAVESSHPKTKRRSLLWKRKQWAASSRPCAARTA